MDLFHFLFFCIFKIFFCVFMVKEVLNYSETKRDEESFSLKCAQRKRKWEEMGKNFGLPLILIVAEDDIGILRRNANEAIMSFNCYPTIPLKGEFPSPSSQEVPASFRSGQPMLMLFWNKRGNQGDEATGLNQLLAGLISDKDLGTHPLSAALKTRWKRGERGTSRS